MIIAQFSVSPLGKGISLGKYVKELVEIIKNSNVKFETNPMSTTVEIDNLSSLFNLIEKLNEKLFNLGIERVITDLKIDFRTDKKETMKSKLGSIK
ncbi:MAG: MTH1187 family thiamine-binding protein [Candidatus Lokiarchaeia archaeon]|nr:MTH1187 family thiamine-binding protein [Candidatus Lokiarchaeia archaeon]